MSRRRKVLLIIAALLWFVMDENLVLIVPIYGAIFVDFETPLPVVTQACIDLAGFRHSFLYQPVFYGALIGAVMLAVKKERSGFAIFFVVISLSALAIQTMALFLPAVLSEPMPR